VAAYRGVDAARDLPGALGHQLVVEGFAHAVQALELEGLIGVGELQYVADAVGVVGGELRIKVLAPGKQLAGTGQEGDIGVHLAGEYRIAIQTLLLGGLDLGIPIGALDQPYHEPPVVASGKIGEEIDHLRGTLLVGLQRQPKPLPAAQRRVRGNCLQHLQGEVEPGCLLGVDGQVDIPLGGHDRQCLHARQ